MASRPNGAVLRQIDRLFTTGTVSGLGERQLLERFAANRDEAAFEALVNRHGPMVLGVCRRLLRDPNDVDDAFQATFLVLVRRAGSIRDGNLLGNWLYGVAHRVAGRGLGSARRGERETNGGLRRVGGQHRQRPRRTARPPRRDRRGTGPAPGFAAATDRALPHRGPDPRAGGRAVEVARRHGPQPHGAGTRPASATASPAAAWPPPHSPSASPAPGPSWPRPPCPSP